MTAEAGEAPPSWRRFYESTFSGAERDEFLAALDVTGLDGEIAILRTRLKAHAGKGPDADAGLLKVLELLVKAVRVKYGLGNRDSEALLQAVKAMVQRGDETAGRSET